MKKFLKKLNPTIVLQSIGLYHKPNFLLTFHLVKKSVIFHSHDLFKLLFFFICNKQVSFIF